MTRYNNSVITKEDFRKEIERRDREKLDRIARSKSINKQWLAHIVGYDVDYDSVPAHNQDE